MDYRLAAGIVFRGKENQMTGEKILLWREGEYHYPAAYGFAPFMISYIHEDREIHPAMVIVPGGAYRNASPSEAHLPAETFYRYGYNVFVLVYTVNLLDTPLKMQPLQDISRAVRMIRSKADRYSVDPTGWQCADFPPADIWRQACACIIRMSRILTRDSTCGRTGRMRRSWLTR